MPYCHATMINTFHIHTNISRPEQQTMQTENRTVLLRWSRIKLKTASSQSASATTTRPWRSSNDYDTILLCIKIKKILPSPATSVTERSLKQIYCYLQVHPNKLMIELFSPIVSQISSIVACRINFISVRNLCYFFLIKFQERLILTKFRSIGETAECDMCQKGYVPHNISI